MYDFDRAFPPREWFVAFVDSGRRPVWWMRFVKPGFRHVLAFSYDIQSNQWIFFDPGHERLRLEVLEGDDLDIIVSIIRQRGGKILRTKAQVQKSRRVRVFATCVTAVCHLLGCPCALTPHGLYRILLKRGAEPAFENVG